MLLGIVTGAAVPSLAPHVLFHASIPRAAAGTKTLVMMPNGKDHLFTQKIRGQHPDQSQKSAEDFTTLNFGTYWQ